MKQTSAYCPVCRRRVYATGRPVNHLLHFFITFLTCLFWIPVWIILALTSADNFHCTRCGAKVSAASGEAGYYGDGEDGELDEPRSRKSRASSALSFDCPLCGKEILTRCKPGEGITCVFCMRPITVPD